MRAIQFVHEGLGNSSYVVDLGNGAAVLIDPDRTVGALFACLDIEQVEAGRRFRDASARGLRFRRQ